VAAAPQLTDDGVGDAGSLVARHRDPHRGATAVLIVDSLVRRQVGWDVDSQCAVLSSP
jgi:hypothetical protein